METIAGYRVTELPRRWPGEFLVAFRRDILGTFGRMAATGGDLVRVYIGPRPFVLVTNPDLVRELLIEKHDAFVKSRGLRIAKFLLGEGLLTSEPPLHTWQRKLILPAFHHRRLRAYAGTMVAFVRQQEAVWADGETVVIDRAMTDLTLRIAAKTLFDTEIGRDTETISAALTDSLDMFRRVANPFIELLMRLPLPGTFRLKRARARLDAAVYRIIEERRASGEDRGDLVSMLLAAQDEETGLGMSDRQVRDEVMTLFLAGHETTANALTWTWYLLAQHPHVEARLHAEVDSVLAGQPATFDDLAALTYTRQVFSEAMRLYPPAYLVGREVAAPVTIGGEPLEPGTTVFASPYLQHRDPRFWEQPERFDPDRFAPGSRTERHKFVYLPFSSGRRGCIGEQFAWVEGILVLATLAQRVSLRLVTEPPVAPRPSITLRPKRSIAIQVQRR